MVCKVYVPIMQHDGQRDELTWESYGLPGGISAATYAMREAGIVSLAIEDTADETPRRLHVSGRIDVVDVHVDEPHYRGRPDPLAMPAAAVSADDDERMPF